MTLTRSRTTVVVSLLLLAVASSGCSKDASVRYANSAGPARLVMHVKVPESVKSARPGRMPHVGPGQRAVATPLPRTARRLFITIAPGSASRIDVPPVDFFLASGDIVEIRVNDIRPGLDVPVEFRAEDEFGDRVRSGFFLLDFVAGMTTSNDFDLAGPGGEGPFLDPDPVPTGPPPPPPPPPPPGAMAPFLVAQNVANRIIRVNAPTMATSTFFDFQANVGPEGLAVEASGNVVVVLNLTGDIQRITGGVTQTINMSPLTDPLSVAVENTGNFVVTERGGGRLARVDNSSGLVASVFSPLDQPSSVFIESPGVFLVTEGGSTNTLSRIDTTGPPTRTVLVDFVSALGRRGPDGVIKDAAGNIIVTLSGPGDGALVRVPAAGPPSIILDFRPKGTGVFQVAQDPATGNYVTTDGFGDVTDVRATGFNTLLAAFGASGSTGIVVSPL